MNRLFNHLKGKLGFVNHINRFFIKDLFMISKTTIKVDKVFIMRALSIRKHDDLSINKWFINVFAKIILMSPTSTTVQTTTDSVLCIG